MIPHQVCSDNKENGNANHNDAQSRKPAPEPIIGKLEDLHCHGLSPRSGEDNREREFPKEHGRHKYPARDNSGDQQGYDNAPYCGEKGGSTNGRRLLKMTMDLDEGTGHRPDAVRKVGGDIPDEQGPYRRIQGCAYKEPHEPDTYHYARKGEGEKTQGFQDA